MTANRRIFISACEASADMHCANLIESVNRIFPEPVDWVGLGGGAMAGRGCRLIAEPVSRAAMLYNVFSQLGYYRSIIRQAKNYIQKARPDLVIVCDSPALNFHIARSAAKLNIPVLFYVAPQLWAWAPWRIGKLRNCCSKLACILPFEEEYFRQRGIDAEFVGSPLFEDIAELPGVVPRNYSAFAPEMSRIALLPGSRDAEIESLFVPMQRIAVSLKQRYKDISFITVASDSSKLDKLRSMHIEDFKTDYAVNNAAQVCSECDFALAASGSVTLQIAGVYCPMTVMYQSSALLWNLAGRWLVNTRYLSLVNILAGRELVPEFMPYFKSIEPVVAKTAELLGSRKKLTAISADLCKLTEPLKKYKASQRTAQIVLEMLRI